MIAILLKMNRRTGLQEIVGVATQRADVETFLASLGNASGFAQFWTTGKSAPDDEVSSIEEWSGESRVLNG